MGNENWTTPQKFFDLWDRKFHFERDVCAARDNTKCRRFFTKQDDALAKLWTGVCWMNPPYNRQTHRWVQKAYDCSQVGATVVCLLPASTDTSWFHTWCTRGHVVFVKGRLSFGGATNRRGEGRARFASLVVVFHPPRGTCPLCRNVDLKKMGSVSTIKRGG
jgi:phage N-6-adenine-methyltransferase